MSLGAADAARDDLSDGLLVQPVRFLFAWCAVAFPFAIYAAETPALPPGAAEVGEAAKGVFGRAYDAYGKVSSKINFVRGLQWADNELKSDKPLITRLSNVIQYGTLGLDFGVKILDPDKPTDWLGVPLPKESEGLAGLQKYEAELTQRVKTLLHLYRDPPAFHSPIIGQLRRG